MRWNLGDSRQTHKDVCFIPIKQTFLLDKLTKLYVDKIVSQYGTPVSIISDQDLHFTSKFWPKLQDALETKWLQIRRW